MVTVLAVAATLFGIAMGASPLLQALRMHSFQSSNEVSLLFLSVLSLGSGTWLTYGIFIGNAALIIANSVGFLSWSTALGVALYWRKKNPGKY